MLAIADAPAFFVGINDPSGRQPARHSFYARDFQLVSMPGRRAVRTAASEGDDRDNQRASIARGQALFNSKPIQITGVAGLNDDLNLATIPGTCGTCHDSPNVGNHSVSAPLNIGVADLNGPLDVSYLPMFRLQQKSLVN